MEPKYETAYSAEKTSDTHNINVIRILECVIKMHRSRRHLNVALKCLVLHQ